MSKPDFRLLCTELLVAFERYMTLDGRDEILAAERTALLIETTRKCIDALRAIHSDHAAAKPNGGPSYEELNQLLSHDYRETIEFVCDHEIKAKLMAHSHIEFARAVLARYGTTTTPEAQP